MVPGTGGFFLAVHDRGDHDAVLGLDAALIVFDGPMLGVIQAFRRKTIPRINILGVPSEILPALRMMPIASATGQLSAIVVLAL